jgi:hypothetical protein
LRCRVQRVMSTGGSGMPALIEQGPYRTAGTPLVRPERRNWRG